MSLDAHNIFFMTKTLLDNIWLLVEIIFALINKENLFFMFNRSCFVYYSDQIAFRVSITDFILHFWILG